MYYFEHDTDASRDDKIVQLRLTCGGAAVDAYWYLIEYLYREERPLCIRNAGAMQTHCHNLCTDEKTLKTWIETMVSIGLLETSDDGENVYSNRANSAIGTYRDKAEKASQAAKTRWENANAMRTHSKRSANAKRTQSERNANKNKNSSNAIKSITTTENASVGAVAVDTAPPEANLVCKKCGRPVHFDLKAKGFYCPQCERVYKPADVFGDAR